MFFQKSSIRCRTCSTAQHAQHAQVRESKGRWDARLHSAGQPGCSGSSCPAHAVQCSAAAHGQARAEQSRRAHHGSLGVPEHQAAAAGVADAAGRRASKRRKRASEPARTRAGYIHIYQGMKGSLNSARAASASSAHLNRSSSMPSLRWSRCAASSLNRRKASSCRKQQGQQGGGSGGPGEAAEAERQSLGAQLRLAGCEPQQMQAHGRQARQAGRPRTCSCVCQAVP